jgi:prevent-host-death family protein
MNARVGIRELRNNVASVVRRAAAGERIVVTVEGVPTAQLGPVTPRAAAELTLDDLVVAGLAEPPARRDDLAPEAPDAEDVPVDVRLDRVIDELRGSR